MCVAWGCSIPPSCAPTSTSVGVMLNKCLVTCYQPNFVQHLSVNKHIFQYKCATRKFSIMIIACEIHALDQLVHL